MFERRESIEAATDFLSSPIVPEGCQFPDSRNQEMMHGSWLREALEVHNAGAQKHPDAGWRR
jgi:hypothetical protein